MDHPSKHGISKLPHGTRSPAPNFSPGNLEFLQIKEGLAMGS